MDSALHSPPSRKLWHHPRAPPPAVLSRNWYHHLMVDVDAIKREVAGRKHAIDIWPEWSTPSGRARSVPMFVTTVQNRYLRQEQVLRASDETALKQKAENRLSAWADEEIRRRTREAKEDASEEAEDSTQEAQAAIEAIRGILPATLSIDDRIQWDALFERSEFKKFVFRGPPDKPETPWHRPAPTKSIWSWLFPTLRGAWRTECERVEAEYAAEVRHVEEGYRAALAQWEMERETSRQIPPPAKTSGHA